MSLLLKYEELLDFLDLMESYVGLTMGISRIPNGRSNIRMFRVSFPEAPDAESSFRIRSLLEEWAVIAA